MSLRLQCVRYMFFRYTGIGFFRFWLVSMHPCGRIALYSSVMLLLFVKLSSMQQSLGPGRNFRAFTGCGIGTALRD